MRTEDIANIEIVMMPVNSIIPYWRNPRRNDKTVEALCEVIQKNGFNVPIVVDRNNVVVKGHARLRAAKRLGMGEVPCIVSNAPEDVIKADRIADNKIQEMSSWEFGKLNLELGTHETPIFNKLFRPDELERHEFGDGQMPAFTPVSIANGFGDGDWGENWQESVGIGQAQAGDVASQATVVVSGSQVVGGGADEGVPAAPVKRTLKTLCPYCGKIVMVDV